MKKRAALLVAIVLLCALVIGVMPVNAAATAYYHNLTSGTYLDITLAAGETIDAGFNTSVVQVFANVNGAYTHRIFALANGSTVVSIKNAAGTVIKEYNITVGASSVGLADVSESTSMVLTQRLTTNYTNLFVGENYTVTAVVKNGAADVSSKVRYVWEITSGNATVKTNSYGSVATVTVNSATSAGQHITGKVTVYGGNGGTKVVNFTTASDVYPRYGSTVISDVKAYSGSVSFIFYDRNNGGIEVSASSLTTVPSLTGLGRTYTAAVGRQVGMSNKVIADASPRTVSFDPATGFMSATIKVGVKISGSTIPGSSSNPSMGYGYLTLGNGYAIIESIEAANNLAVMAPGQTQQVTTAMLGGMPVNASGITYAVADPKIATVTSAGKITALTTGVTTLNVYYNGVQVIGKHLFVLDNAGEPEEADEKELTLGLTSLSRKLNKRVRFRVSAKNVKFDGKIIAHKNLDWSSSKTSVATVDANGYVRTLARGTCYIYATYTDAEGEEFTARFKLTVK